MKSYEEIAGMLAAHVARRTGRPSCEVDRARRLDQLGIDSAESIGLMGELEDFVGRPLSASLPYAYPTIEQLARCVANGDG